MNTATATRTARLDDMIRITGADIAADPDLFLFPARCLNASGEADLWELAPIDRVDRTSTGFRFTADGGAVVTWANPEHTLLVAVT